MLDENQKVFDLVNLKIVPNIDDEFKKVDIITIITIVTALVSLIRECKNLREKLENDSDDIMRTINRPNAINKIRLYLIMRKQCRKDGTQKYLNALVKAVLEAGRTATKEDIQTICNSTLII